MSSTRAILLPPSQPALPPSSRVDPLKEDAHEVESHRMVINAKLVDEAVKRCATAILYVETSDVRATVAALYNDLWDAALCHKKAPLDCRVVQSGQCPDPGAAVISADTLRDLLTDERSMPYVLYDNPLQRLPRLETVALGGTFDRLHNGHKKLLSVAMQVATKLVIVGVTADSMLKGKRNAELIQALDARVARTKEFCRAFAPAGLEVEIVVIEDPWGPTVTRADVQGIVVSSETLHGAALINEQRAGKGFAPLLPVLILRSNQYILSSTFVRTLL
jgi:cytidyltransferase-like protein